MTWVPLIQLSPFKQNITNRSLLEKTGIVKATSAAALLCSAYTPGQTTTNLESSQTKVVDDIASNLL